jgi:tetratricopeptide repeat protein 8
MQAGP